MEVFDSRHTFLLFSSKKDLFSIHPVVKICQFENVKTCKNYKISLMYQPQFKKQNSKSHNIHICNLICS